MLTQWLCELQSTLSIPLLSALQTRLDALRVRQRQLEARREQRLLAIAAEEASDELVPLSSTDSAEGQRGARDTFCSMEEDP